MPASKTGLRVTLSLVVIILSAAFATGAIQRGRGEALTQGPVPVNLLINYGNGTLQWHNNTLIPNSWNFYNVTVFVTNGDLAAIFFSAFQSHFVYRISGAGCPDSNPFCEVAWSLWILNGVCWKTSDTGPDLIPVSEGKTVAWFLVPLATFGQDAPTGVNCVTVEVDIRPGSDRNLLNLRSVGRVPVAILSTSEFDATTIDPTTVKFGRTGTEASALGSSLEDVESDGDLDMVLNFKLQETGILQGDTQAVLMGRTFSGTLFKGSDNIETVLPGGGSFARSV